MLWFALLCLLFTLLAWRMLFMVMRPPSFVIGTPEAPYMNRWWVIPRNRFFNIYLHEILRSDDDRALHDHPWFNVSIVLVGGYCEIRPISTPTRYHPVPTPTRRWRGAGSIVCRLPTSAHRLEVDEGKRCWSLFITGPVVRTWGFWCPRGWKPWQEFVDMSRTGAIGPGCGN